VPDTFLPLETVRAAVAAPGVAVVASPRPCPVCGQAMTGRKTSACSDRCRATKSRRTRTEGQSEREGRVRELLEAALRVLVRVDEPEA
jgi:predicted nucleic acid-binding Zn ribbon protein